jgi:hypothetical protein
MNSLLKFEMYLPMMRECIAPLPQGQAETVSATPPQITACNLRWPIC